MGKEEKQNNFCMRLEINLTIFILHSPLWWVKITRITNQLQLSFSFSFLTSLFGFFGWIWKEEVWMVRVWGRWSLVHDFWMKGQRTAEFEAEPSQAEPSQAEQSRKKLSRAEQSRAKPNKAESSQKKLNLASHTAELMEKFLQKQLKLTSINCSLQTPNVFNHHKCILLFKLRHCQWKHNKISLST